MRIEWTDAYAGGSGTHFDRESFAYVAGALLAFVYIPIFAITAVEAGISALMARKLYKSSPLYHILSYIKRPVNTYAARNARVYGAARLLRIRKTYGWVALTGSIYNPFVTYRLLEDKKYGRASINWFGPAGSLYTWDWIMSRSQSEKVAASEDVVLPEIHRGRSRGTSSSSKKLSYTPKRKWQCRKGYRYDPKKNLCVKALKKT